MNNNSTVCESSVQDKSIPNLDQKIIESISQDEEEDDRLQSNEDFRKKYKWYFLPFATLIFVGGFFTNSFQAFIQEQFKTSMHIDNSQYSLFVLIPPIPNFILPIFAGPILDLLGIRLSIFIFAILQPIGMALCLISYYGPTFWLMVFGKTLHQIGSELIQIAQSSILVKWFDSKSLTFAYTVGSFVSKISSSCSGIFFPLLYNVNQDLQIPLIVSILVCFFSFLCAVGLIYMDKEADKKKNRLKESLSKNKIINIKWRDLKKMGGLYWIYACQSGLCFGGFYSFINYLQGVLVEKFGVEKTEAGQMVSIPFWFGMSAPIFGFIAGQFGRRIYCLTGVILMGFTTILLLLIVPGETGLGLQYFCLIIFGLFVGSLCAYLLPSYPLIIEKRFVGTAFGIGYASKNLGLSLFSFIGGATLGEKGNNFVPFFIFYLGVFSLAILLQFFAYILDRQQGGNLNSAKPKIPAETQEIISRFQSFVQ